MRSYKIFLILKNGYYIKNSLGHATRLKPGSNWGQKSRCRLYYTNDMKLFICSDLSPVSHTIIKFFVAV